MLDRIQEYFKDKLDYPAETKDTDYKSAVKFDERTDFAAKLVKHILGFANSGGGYIVIGFRERPDRSLEPAPAITEEIVGSYEVTRLSQCVEKYLAGQDRIKLAVYKIPSSRGTLHPIISVGRFPEYPFVCTSDYVSSSTGEPIIESGQIYIRTEGARTLTVKTPSEWRQLIRECMKAGKEIEARGPSEGTGRDWGNLFSEWVKRENENALKEMNVAGFKEGFYGFIIRVPYGLTQVDNNTLLNIARKSECRNTGWPIGVVLEKPEYKPVSLADGIRAVISHVLITVDKVELREFDYWALNNRGHFFFIRSHEDGYLREKAGGNMALAYDVVIWRISEMLHYASNLSTELNLKESDKVGLNLYYEGLKGRILTGSGHYILPSVRTQPCVEDKFEKKMELEVANIMPRLKDYVYEITSELFGLFDFFKLDRARVDRIVDDFLGKP
jgi:hypothetical protein